MSDNALLSFLRNASNCERNTPDGQESWRAGAAVRMFGYWFSFGRCVSQAVLDEIPCIGPDKRRTPRALAGLS
jgi:hypothetical protein